MTQYVQRVRPNFNADTTIKNTEASASMTKGHIVKVDGATYGTTRDPLPCVNVATSDDESVAHAVVVDDTITAGALGRVCEHGYVVAIAGTGGVTIGDLLMLDSATGKEGRVKTLADAVTHVGLCVGRAHETAGDGEYCLIWFDPHAGTTA